MSFAQHRVVTGSRAIASAEELRGLIDLHGAWGWTLAEFQDRAGVRFEGDTAYVTQFYWAGGEETLESVWARVQEARGGRESKGQKV
ncbi:hypothetical protein SU48_04410 [Deinococcus puniceus]|uniref:Uncharacterized protein n=2 Tax=Deinococcus puniceus TaxID=1182568 RepID=A0A172TCU1_9DEIO|nr:hypothetical protein SU48_04410 [Deinococcus puniceus]